MGLLRLFVAVEVDARVKEQVRAWMSALRDALPFARWVPVDNLHVTLHFLDEQPPARIPVIVGAMYRVAREIPPFFLQLGPLGTFSRQGVPSVLWAAVEGDVAVLRDAHRRLGEAFCSWGYRPDPRPYTPHLTLARNGTRPLRPNELAACAPAMPMAWRVMAIALFRSELHPGGARYTVLARAPLCGGQRDVEA
ncbi:MAG TPA: RNA 2',3'-cyclic phosphodiesterase [Calditerricola sp.]